VTANEPTTLTGRERTMSDKRVEWSSAYLWGWEKGVEAERDRIIALLETHHRETQGRGDLAVKYESAVLRCLALIKGENK